MSAAVGAGSRPRKCAAAAQVIKASVPMAEMLEYASALTSLTGGKGAFHMEFSHYDQIPAQLREKVIAEAQAQRETRSPDVACGLRGSRPHGARKRRKSSSVFRPRPRSTFERTRPPGCKRLAAGGALPLPPVELVTVLFVLTHDGDAEVKSEGDGQVSRSSRRACQ